MRRALLLALLLLALLPGAARAMTFGSDLSLPADTLSSTCAPATPPCTILLYKTHAGNAFPATAPVAGVVTSFGIKAGAAETVTFRLGRINSGIPFNGTGDGTGPTVSIKGPGTYSFPASMWVRAGDSVGIDTSSTASFSTLPSCSGTAVAFFYSPPLANGGAPRAANANARCEWLVNAEFTPSPRGLALQRCKHRRKAVRRKCRRNARKLPVRPG